MNIFQKYLLLIITLYSIVGLIKGLRESLKGHAFSEAKYFYMAGAFVWGDMAVFGIFWIIAIIIVYSLNSWVFFLLIVSVFWFVRSLGETIYWFNQQFSPKRSESPEKFWHYKIFKNESIWFINQIFWQCITVISIITTLYFASLWVASF